jgi:hypothetical protein
VIVGIHQPNYLPWCGYFTKIRHSDVFVILDDALFPNRSYGPRTKVRVAGEAKWLSVPVRSRPDQLINEVEIAEGNWASKQLTTLTHSYGKAPFFDEVMGLISPILQSHPGQLAELNLALIKSICHYLELDREFLLSSSMSAEGTGDDRLISIVKSVGATTYLSGPGGEKYQDRAKFEASGIELMVKTYRPVPYEAKSFPFLPALSIVDAVFLLGKKAIDVLEYRES